MPAPSGPVERVDAVTAPRQRRGMLLTALAVVLPLVLILGVRVLTGAVPITDESVAGVPGASAGELTQSQDEEEVVPGVRPPPHDRGADRRADAGAPLARAPGDPVARRPDPGDHALTGPPARRDLYPAADHDRHHDAERGTRVVGLARSRDDDHADTGAGSDGG